MSAPLSPLSGVTVLDLSRILAGPYCTMVLGDLGAEVLKVEPPNGDDSRGWGAAKSSLEPQLYNKDLAPTKIAERMWGTYDVAALWVGLSVNIPTYMLAAGLIQGA